MKPYQAGDIKPLLEQTYEDCRRRGCSEFTALTVAEMKVIDLIRAWIQDGDFDEADDPETD